MAAGRKTNAKGRSTGKQTFVMLTHWAFDCEAYRSLKPGPRALLWEFIRRHNGANNGRIAFSQRDQSASIGVADRETVAGYVRQLMERGFLVVARRGGFSVKAADRRASEWTLTMFPVGDAPATKEFMRWCPSKIRGTEKPTCKDGKSVPEPANDVRPCPTGTENPSLSRPKQALIGTENPSTYTSIAIGSAAEVCAQGSKKPSTASPSLSTANDPSSSRLASRAPPANCGNLRQQGTGKRQLG